METLPGSPKYMNIKEVIKVLQDRGFLGFCLALHTFLITKSKKREKRKKPFHHISTKRVREKMGYTK